MIYHKSTDKETGKKTATYMFGECYIHTMSGGHAYYLDQSGPPSKRITRQEAAQMIRDRRNLTRGQLRKDH